MNSTLEHFAKEIGRIQLRRPAQLLVMADEEENVLHVDICIMQGNLYKFGQVSHFDVKDLESADSKAKVAFTPEGIVKDLVKDFKDFLQSDASNGLNPSLVSRTVKALGAETKRLTRAEFQGR